MDWNPTVSQHNRNRLIYSSCATIGSESTLINDLKWNVGNSNRYSDEFVSTSCYEYHGIDSIPFEKESFESLTYLFLNICDRHRMRMGSRPVVAGHFFFGTMMVVMLPSYYFCYRRREHQEQVIEMMMQYNQFGHASDLPEEPPLEEHPFWQQNENGMNTLDAGTKHDREFRGMIKERKEWQKKQDPSFDKIFQEKQ